jgi:hypothetical protein
MDPTPPKLEYVFTIRVKLGQRQKFGAMPGGGVRGFVSAAGGEIEGPRLQGEVVPYSGGDWAQYRPDGTVAFDARYVLKARDGTQIYIMSTGYRHAPPDILAKMEALEPVDPSSYYMRVAPRFEAPVGPHDWLTRTVFVGTVERHADHSVFHYFAVL